MVLGGGIAGISAVESLRQTRISEYALADANAALAALRDGAPAGAAALRP